MRQGVIGAEAFAQVEERDNRKNEVLPVVTPSTSEFEGQGFISSLCRDGRPKKFSAK